ncbi:basic blue protein-like isoform X2 [Asparagus officinalis]|uniref:basic blue protein-like isoform X2 n=1 Tax=Asparagus officinalis TaxID=4686 RepID=UPI00098DF712|nr:basic blue protein-like isoform X2 [Asparagus officinalis]
MDQGRGSCMTEVAVLAILVIVCSPSCSFAATYIVGDSQGWGFSASYKDWANGKPFTAGDTLEYGSCKATGKASTSGNDKFTLKKGANYFLCSIPGHCSSGMKIEVTGR